MDKSDQHMSHVGGESRSANPGCRPCCSFPYGWRALWASIFATLAWAFTVATTNSCHYFFAHFTYCHPPPAQAATYGTCGNCHCINGDKPCPTGAENVPPTEFSDDYIKMLKSLEITNPMKMRCNPYNATDKGDRFSCTDPPQEEYQVELWENAACGIKYNLSSLTPDVCPTEYIIQTYDSEEEMLADGAVMTHWGACGVCSTTKDLAVYMDNPDLTAKGQECGVRGLVDTADGIKCFEEAGYTPPCAEMWMYNVFNTRDYCFGVCVDFTFFGDGANNGPPPQCQIADCLLCDEQMSGPIFQTEAARSRRRSGLLSKIARPCDVILIVPHEHPCNTTREQVNSTTRRLAEVEIKPEADIEGVTSFFSSFSPFLRQLQNNGERPTAPAKFTPPPPNYTCVYQDLNLGIFSYAGHSTNNFFDDDLFLSADAKMMTTKYDTCYRYQFRRAVEGYWANMSEIFGSAHAAAQAFALLASLIGGIVMILTWSSACFAYGRGFWTGMSVCFLFCGLFMLLTLVFFKSGVCENGCEFGEGAAFAIVAGVLWWIATGFGFTTGPFSEEKPAAACCCCPAAIEDSGAYTGAYAPIPPSAEDPPLRTEVSVTETVQSDGSMVVEKVTTLPSGGKTIEVTSTKRRTEAEAAKFTEEAEAAISTEKAEAAETTEKAEAAVTSEKGDGLGETTGHEFREEFDA